MDKQNTKKKIKGMTINGAYKEKTVINCMTEEESDRILCLASKQGWKWRDGSSYIGHNVWKEYKENTCYNFFLGRYSDINYYKEKDYLIIPSTYIESDEEAIASEREIAVAAMQGLLSGDIDVRFGNINTKSDARSLARTSFLIADEFMAYEKEREQRHYNNMKSEDEK